MGGSTRCAEAQVVELQAGFRRRCRRPVTQALCGALQGSARAARTDETLRQPLRASVNDGAAQTSCGDLAEPGLGVLGQRGRLRRKGCMWAAGRRWQQAAAAGGGGWPPRRSPGRHPSIPACHGKLTLSPFSSLPVAKRTNLLTAGHPAADSGLLLLLLAAMSASINSNIPYKSRSGCHFCHRRHAATLCSSARRSFTLGHAHEGGPSNSATGTTCC